MKKATLLSKPCVDAEPTVDQFVEWMSANLDNKTFEHGYKNRRTGEPWICASLSDAFTNYHWPHKSIPRLGVPAGTTFATNAVALRALQAALCSALYPTPSDHAACLSAIDVMDWGGVRAGNVSWLGTNQTGLAKLLIDTRNALNADDTKHPALNAATLRFNAGMTKVYSLICKDFIIYDSRVAAALGWAVVKFCRQKKLAHVPQELRFPWSPAKESNSPRAPKRRNPSEGAYQFPRLQSGPMHAEWNLKASWLLEAILNHANSAGSKFKQVSGTGGPLRALEAALFMIGYDLPPPEMVSRSATSEASDDWTPCYTKRNHNAFAYRITRNSIEVKGGPTFSDADINATLENWWGCSGRKAFPLANGATAVRNGSESDGLGKAYFDATGKNPPNTSKLAAVLEELAVIVRVVSSTGRGLHWTLNSDLLKLTSSATPVNIRPLLDDVAGTQEDL